MLNHKNSVLERQRRYRRQMMYRRDSRSYNKEENISNDNYINFLTQFFELKTSIDDSTSVDSDMNQSSSTKNHSDVLNNSKSDLSLMSTQSAHVIKNDRIIDRLTMIEFVDVQTNSKCIIRKKDGKVQYYDTYEDKINTIFKNKSSSISKESVNKITPFLQDKQCKNEIVKNLIEIIKNEWKMENGKNGKMDK